MDRPRTTDPSRRDVLRGAAGVALLAATGAGCGVRLDAEGREFSGTLWQMMSPYVRTTADGRHSTHRGTDNRFGDERGNLVGTMLSDGILQRLRSP